MSRLCLRGSDNELFCMVVQRQDVEGVEWLHCDLAGPALGYPPGSPRMTGYGVGLLTAMVLMKAAVSHSSKL